MEKSTLKKPSKRLPPPAFLHAVRGASTTRNTAFLNVWIPTASKPSLVSVPMLNFFYAKSFQASILKASFSSDHEIVGKWGEGV